MRQRFNILDAIVLFPALVALGVTGFIVGVVGATAIDAIWQALFQ